MKVKVEYCPSPCLDSEYRPLLVKSAERTKIPVLAAYMETVSSDETRFRRRLCTKIMRMESTRLWVARRILRRIYLSLDTPAVL